MIQRPGREWFFEKHHFLTFLALACMGLGLTTVGVKHPERMKGLQDMGLRITGPVARVGGVVSGAGGSAWEGIRRTWTAQGELDDALTQLDELKLASADHAELVAENERLRGLLDLA